MGKWEAGQKVLRLEGAKREAVVIDRVTPAGWACVGAEVFNPDGTKRGLSPRERQSIRTWGRGRSASLRGCSLREWETVGTYERLQRLRSLCRWDLTDDWTLKLSDETLAALERDLGISGPEAVSPVQRVFGRLLGLLQDTTRPPPELVGQTYGDAVPVWGDEILDCPSHEYDNRTTVENSRWLGWRLRAVLLGEKGGEHG